MSEVRGFHKPNLELEQYVTPPEIVSQLVWTAFLRGEVAGKKAVDLGCGTGRFCAALSYLGAECICVDVDPTTALRSNPKVSSRVNVVQAEVPHVEIRADVVFQNPPFGVHRRHADLMFLKNALKIAPVVYSIHKSDQGLRNIVIQLVENEGLFWNT